MSMDSILRKASLRSCSKSPKDCCSPCSSTGSPKLKSKKRKQETVLELTPDVLISKVIQHSKNPKDPRILKYLQQIKKSFSSSNLKLWIDLRTKGGLYSIEGIIRKCSNAIQGESMKSDNNEISSDIIITSLSVLGNAYSLDYCARKDVGKSGFIDALHKLLQIPNSLDEFQAGSSSNNSKVAIPSTVETLLPPIPPFTDVEFEIKTRTVKCIANLSHDSNCRSTIFKSGLGISILKMLECVNRYQDVYLLSKKNSEETPASVSCDKPCSSMDECVKASVRAIRILSSDSLCNEEAKAHLIRFGAINTIGHIFNWTNQDDLKLDAMRALANLTDKIKLLPSEQIQELVDEDNSNTMLKTLVTLFNVCSFEDKLFFPTIRCLINFGGNTEIAEAMGRRQIFKVALDKLKNTCQKSSSDVCRLLMTLTKHSGFNRCLLNNCQEVWTTLSILRSETLQEYHRWLLNLYENVYEGTLKSLLRNGLIELVHEHFKKEIENCDFETLKSKILSMEESTCRIHGENCQFIPTYRCDSPSYQQVQEEMKLLLKDRHFQYKPDGESSGSSGFDSGSSPSSSPARSWCSDDSGSESGLVIPRGRSPTSSSEDEGCYSPVYSHLSFSPTYSEGSPDNSLPLDNSFSSEKEQHRAKNPRLDSNSTSPIPFATQDRIQSTSKKSDNIKHKSKKIVVMLKILQKSTFLSPMPPPLVDIVPILLSFIIRGIVSLAPQRQKYEDFSNDLEMVKLGRFSFSSAYKILKAIFQNIHFFPELLKNGSVGIIITRLLPWDKNLAKIGNNESMSVLLDTLSGKSNGTSGYREGRLLRTLLISTCEEDLNSVALTVPLLFKKNDHTLRSFESKGQSWTRLFDLLPKTKDISSSIFQDCILSISTLCETIGMKYNLEDIKGRPMLTKLNGSHQLDEIITFLNKEECGSPDLAELDNGKVEITLDDGSSALITKSILTDASPVWTAMFDGHFKEAGSQKVKMRDVSKETLIAVIEQLFAISNPEVSKDTSYNYELSTLFELVSLSDQFLLENIYEKTLNTLLYHYICPYSAPEIYSKASKLSTLWKPQSRLTVTDTDLTFVVMKFLLVGDLSMSCRCAAFRKIFDSVDSDTVVGDMRALVEFYSTRPQQNR